MFESVFRKMRECAYPLYIWGNGSMAHVVYNKLQKEGVDVCGYFVNVDMQYAEQHEDILPCLTLAQLKEQGKDFAVVMGHGHIELLPEIQQEALVKAVYMIPNPYDYYLPDKDVVRYAFSGGIDEVAPYFADQESRDNLWAYFAVHSGQEREFYQTIRKLKGMFLPDVWKLREEEVYYDIGAWNGDTVREFLVASNGSYRAIEAFEPDAEAVRTLRHSVAGQRDIHCHKMGIAGVQGTMQMHGGGIQSNYLQAAEDGDTPVCRLDDLTDALLPPTLIKIGVPRLMFDILRGGEKTIRKYKPRLLTGIVWNWGEDIFAIIKWIRKTNPEYKMALRYRLLMPTQLWLYAY